MKKIVALVLAMVMVLGLATVAFGATTTATVKEEGYSLVSMNNATDTDVAADFTKTVTDKVVTTVGDKTTTTYYADSYVIGGVKYYACDATIATTKLVKDGVVVAYLTSADLSAGTTKVATAFVEAKEKPACGDVTKDSYVVDGKSYPVGGATYVLYNGLFVSVDMTATTPVVEHVFAKKAVTTDTKGTPVAIACDECKASFQVVKKVPAAYAGKVNSTILPGYFVLMGTYAPAAGETVESAKTFDAGIAMYVGMSVMAAAGSAVVLKKKD